MRTLVWVIMVAVVAIVPAAAEDPCTVLQKQTQAFSVAGQRGDGKRLATFLDDDVIFFNETGDKATKTDLSAPGSPAPGLNRTITTTDWDCKLHDHVAVTSFVDVVEMGPANKRDQFRYRSVETWFADKNVWKMIGSETLALPVDPAAVAIDAETLEKYVGTYQAGPQMHLTFKRRGDDLFASLNGGVETAQLAMARDIVFTKGHGNTPKVFQRDDDGRIIGFAYLVGTHILNFRRVG